MILAIKGFLGETAISAPFVIKIIYIYIPGEIVHDSLVLQVSRTRLPVPLMWHVLMPALVAYSRMLLCQAFHNVSNLHSLCNVSAADRNH